MTAPPLPLRPTADRVLVRMDDAPEQSRGGLILLAHDREYEWRGTVLAVGPGYLTRDGHTVPLEVKPGDRVMVSPGARSGEKLPGFTDHRRMMVRAEDVIAVIEAEG